MSAPLDDFAHRVLWLGRVRLGVQRVLLARARPGDGNAVPSFPPRWSDEVAYALSGLPVSGDAAMAAMDEACVASDRDLRARLGEAREAQGAAPGDRLRQGVGLSHEEECLLWAVAAPDLDPALARLVRVLQEGGSGGVSTGFALLVAFGARFEALDAARRLLAPDRALMRLRLLVSPYDHDARAEAALGSEVRVHPSVLHVLGGAEPRLWPGLQGVVSVSSGEAPTLELAEAEREEISAVFERAARGRTASTGMRVWLVGPEGSGRRSIGRRLAGDLGYPHWVVDVPAWLDEPDPGAVLADVIRDARLAGAMLHLHHADALLAPNRTARSAMTKVTSLLADHAHDVLFDSVTEPQPDERLPFVYWLRLPLPWREQRRAIWRACLGEGADEAALEDLSRRYFLSGGRIREAAARALGRAARRRGRLRPTLSELAEEARHQQSTEVGDLAHRVEHTQSWDDVVLPSEVTAQLGEVLDFARHRAHIFESWGFHRKLSYGRGIAVLLSGPPGTGKTMVAGILATELGLDLYRIDLSQVTSKYIGETEKNLKSLFEYARQAHAALLFDEADSLFARRTDVQSSVDRYANLEVNYLLQKIEEFDGISILTTNFRQALDEAFLRRIRFKIELPAPTEAERERLWAGMIPREAPCASDVDPAALAHAYDFAGAHIQSAVLRAAARAAASGQPLSMALLRDAADQALREAGKVVRARTTPAKA